MNSLPGNSIAPCLLPLASKTNANFARWHHAGHRLWLKLRQSLACTNSSPKANIHIDKYSQMKDDFVVSVSHELRTPLTSIKAFSEILFEDPKIELEERKRFLRIIVNEADKLTSLINHVLDFGKIESGHFDWNYQSFDLAKAVQNAIALFQESESNNLEINVDIPENGPYVNCDRALIMQGVINLLSNAEKFVPNNQHSRTLWVTLRTIDGNAIVSFRDNGPGIEKEAQVMIFEKFWQGGNTLTEKPEGIGLGLPMSRLIFERFGGSLSVESQPGNGATFSFSLPLQSTLNE